jgi:hypothetical protein
MGTKGREAGLLLAIPAEVHSKSLFLVSHFQHRQIHSSQKKGPSRATAFDRILEKPLRKPTRDIPPSPHLLSGTEGTGHHFWAL